MILTLTTAVTYVIQVAPTNTAPNFVFDGTGSAYAGSPSINSTLSFRINSNLIGAISSISSGQTLGAITSDDTQISGPHLVLQVGSVITLFAGSLTTSGNFAGSPPASGSYNTFLTDFSGVNITPLGGVAVAPEHSTWALLGVGVAGAVAFRRRTHA